MGKRTWDRIRDYEIYEITFHYFKAYTKRYSNKSIPVPKIY